MMQLNRLQRFISNNPLYFVFAIPFFTDSILTLFGQGSPYWHNPRSANEVSPTYFILALGPFIYAIFALGWAAILYLIMQRVKEPFNFMLSMGFLVYHTQGSSSWLALELKRASLHFLAHRLELLFSWLFVAIYLIIVGVFAGYSLTVYNRKHQ
jgi:hypothetical protein